MCINYILGVIINFYKYIEMWYFDGFVTYEYM